MIEASRSYETHAKMIQTIDEMTRRSIDEVGKG
jgi:flagellar basal body rod protein FlgG